MRRLTDFLATARADLAGVPRKFWIYLLGAVAAEGVLLVLALKLL